MSSGPTQQTRQRSQATDDGSTGSSQRLSFVGRYLRRGTSSGLFAAIAGLVTVGRVRRTLREGSSERAIRQAMMAVFWIGVAMTQWGMDRSGGQAGRRSGVVDTLSDVAGGSTGGVEQSSDESASIDITERNPTPDVEGDGSDSDGEERDDDTEPTVEDAAAAEGVERAQDAEGIEDVEDAEGVTDLDETTDSDDESE